jgi:hypothetical protein
MPPGKFAKPAQRERFKKPSEPAPKQEEQNEQHEREAAQDEQTPAKSEKNFLEELWDDFDRWCDSPW